MKVLVMQMRLLDGRGAGCNTLGVRLVGLGNLEHA